MAMTDQELMDAVARLQALRPSPAQFTHSVSTSKGSGRRAVKTETQQLDQEGLNNARADFDASPTGRQLQALQTELKSRQDYSGSAIGSLAAPASYFGEIPGAGLGWATMPKGEVAPVGTNALGRFATFAPYAIRAIGGALGGTGAELYAQDPNNEPWSRDAAQGAATTLGGYSLYGLGQGALNALQTVGRSTDKNNNNNPPPGPLTLPATGTARTEGTNALADYFSAPQGKTKAITTANLGPAIDNASEPLIRQAAKDISSTPYGEKIDAAKASLADVRSYVSKYAKFIGGPGKMPILALLAGGAAAALAPGDTAEASPYAPGEDALNALPSRGQEVANRLSNAASFIGNSLSPRNIPDDFAANMPGLQGGDLAVSPEQYAARNLQAAQAEDARQVAEMRANQAEAAPRQFAQPTPQDFVALDKMLHSTQRPNYQAALKELIEAHGGTYGNGATVQ